MCSPLVTLISGILRTDKITVWTYPLPNVPPSEIWAWKKQAGFVPHHRGSRHGLVAALHLWHRNKNVFVCVQHVPKIKQPLLKNKSCEQYARSLEILYLPNSNRRIHHAWWRRICALERIPNYEDCRSAMRWHVHLLLKLCQPCHGQSQKWFSHQHPLIDHLCDPPILPCLSMTGRGRRNHHLAWIQHVQASMSPKRAIQALPKWTLTHS